MINKKNLRIYMASEGINQSQFCERVGIDTATLRRFLRYGEKPSFKTLIKICQATTLTPNDLIIIEKPKA